MIGGWDGIEEFVAVARAGSFTAGAKGFNASVTHMSRSIARLEAKLDTRLFNRTTRSLYLTEAGREFFARCQRMVEEREAAIAALGQQDEPVGLLRITCSYALGEMFISPLVREFAQMHPGVQIDIDLDNDVVDIAARGFDLAIRTGQLEDSRLIATRIAQRELITVASRGYLADRGRPSRLEDLSAHECLVGSSPQWHFRYGQNHRPHGRWRCNSGSSLLDACLAGMGICQLPAFYVGEHMAAGRLQEVLAELKPDDEPIWAVHTATRHPAPKITRLVAHLRARLTDMLAR